MTYGPAERGTPSAGRLRQAVDFAKRRPQRKDAQQERVRLLELLTGPEEGRARRLDADDLRLVAEAQALEQQQEVFAQRKEQDRALFRIERAMGWAMFALLLASPVLPLLAPIASAAAAPVAAASAWYWRRMLRRDRIALAPVTRSRFHVS